MKTASRSILIICGIKTINNPIQNKICTKCRSEKPIDRFGISNRFRDGHKPHCKECACREEKRRRFLCGDDMRVRERARRSENVEIRRAQERRAGARYRSKPGFYDARRAAGIVQRMELHKRNATVYDCLICGIQFCLMFGRFGAPKTCSDDCRLELKKRRVTKKSAKRRAYKKGAATDVIDPIAVFERDGWTCQICGCDTPKELRGTNHDDAPELDHIVPLSRDGAHTWDNTQCACRLCNIMKGAMTMDEFRLWNQGHRGGGHKEFSCLTQAAAKFHSHKRP